MALETSAKPQVRKLKSDAIVEALLEIRFESEDIAEIIVGRLGDIKELDGYRVQRLGASDIPESLRKADPNLKYQAILSKSRQDNKRVARIGSNVFSYHCYAPYPGWDDFCKELSDITKAVLDKLTNPIILRAGFRYINLMSKSLHGIQSLTDLDLKIEVDGDQIEDKAILTFLSANSSHKVITKVATPEFVNMPNENRQDISVVIDVDVFTDDNAPFLQPDGLVGWFTEAHDLEKKAFFSLIPESVLMRLVEEE